MKAIAIKNEDNKTETIIIDGKVFLKNVKIGKWNFISRVKKVNKEDDYEFTDTGKHSTHSAAMKFSGTYSKGAVIVERDIAEIER